MNSDNSFANSNQSSTTTGLNNQNARNAEDIPPAQLDHQEGHGIEENDAVMEEDRDDGGNDGEGEENDDANDEVNGAEYGEEENDEVDGEEEDEEEPKKKKARVENLEPFSMQDEVHASNPLNIDPHNMPPFPLIDIKDENLTEIDQANNNHDKTENTQNSPFMIRYPPESFINVSPSLLENLRCPICFDVIKNPKSCSKCGNSFCSDCIHTWRVQNHTCPCCKKKNFEYVSEIRIQNIVDNLTMKCPCSRDCDWTGLVANFDNHCQSNHRQILPLKDSIKLIGIDLNSSQHGGEHEYNVLQELLTKLHAWTGDAYDLLRDICKEKIFCYLVNKFYDCIVLRQESDTSQILCKILMTIGKLASDSFAATYHGHLNLDKNLNYIYVLWKHCFYREYYEYAAVEVKLHSIACFAKHPVALYEMGQQLEESNNYKEAIKWYELSASRGFFEGAVKIWHVEKLRTSWFTLYKERM